MIDDVTLAEWEQDIEQALRPSSVQQGAMWAGLMGSHLRAAIAEIRRLREEYAELAKHLEDTVDPEARRLLDAAVTNLAAHQAVVRELVEAASLRNAIAHLAKAAEP